MDYDATSISLKAVSVVVAVVIVALIFVPIINDMSREEINIDQVNNGATGADLSLFTFGEGEEDYTVLATLSEGNVTFSGDYSGTVSASSDSVIMLSNDQSLFVSGGKMLYTANGETSEVTSQSISINASELNGQAYEWAYFPETDGKYASFPNGFQYNISDTVVGVGTFAGVSLISKDTTVTSDNTYDLNATVNTSNGRTTGVTYSK